MRRDTERRAGRRTALMAGRNAALALACAAAVGLPAARAQGGAAQEDAPPLPELAYDTYFEPFTDNPVLRVHRPEPFKPVEPLFKKFDPLDGLSREARVSRVVTSGLGIASFPIITAKVGDHITVPYYFRDVRPIPAYVLRMNYDPKVLRATSAVAANWPQASMDYNVKPDKISPERRVFVVQYSGDPWTPDGAPARIAFDVIGPGDSALTIEDADVSDDTFTTVKMVAHDGLVRVSP